MELNSKKLERTSKIVYYAISVALCFFLVLLSNNIIGDLDSTVTPPLSDDYANKPAMAKIEKATALYNAEMEILRTKKEAIDKTIETAKGNYGKEKESFDTWVETRKTLGAPDKDKEVLQRAKNLDELRAVEQDWTVQLNAVESQLSDRIKKNEAEQKINERETAATMQRYEAARKSYDLKVFLIRLLFVAPILALGIFFFIRYRQHKFWPLYFGFTLFSLYAFFFGLVPYLPSYGGYVHYTVGILVSIGVGYYAIQHIRAFIAQKQAELQETTVERAKKIHVEAAEKALENHFCPSCGKDFILKKWEFPTNKSIDKDGYQLVTDFCRHCGLGLFCNCGNCGNKNFAHLPYCASCGVKSAVI